MNKKSLDLHPFLLLICEIVRTLPLLDFIIELINNNRNKQIHNEECRKEDVYYIQQSNWRPVLMNSNVILCHTILSVKHHIRPHLQC